MKLRETLSVSEPRSCAAAFCIGRTLTSLQCVAFRIRSFTLPSRRSESGALRSANKSNYEAKPRDPRWLLDSTWLGGLSEVPLAKGATDSYARRTFVAFRASVARRKEL